MKRILIVEKEDFVSAALQQILLDMGFSVVGQVKTGEDALKFAAHTPLDLVWMDLRLEGTLDGFETGKILHQKYGLPILFSSGSKNPCIRMKIETNPGFGYISQPIHPYHLRENLVRLLHPYQQRQGLGAA
jgi:two-component system, response regulator PdtaR